MTAQLVSLIACFIATGINLYWTYENHKYSDNIRRDRRMVEAEKQRLEALNKQLTGIRYSYIEPWREAEVPESIMAKVRNPKGTN